MIGHRRHPARYDNRMLFKNRDTPKRDRPRFLQILIFLFLLGVGALIISTGPRAIRTRHYESEWQQSGGLEVGPLSIGISETHGVDRYEGAKAFEVGIGLTALGAMFVLWGHQSNFLRDPVVKIWI